MVSDTGKGSTGHETINSIMEVIWIQIQIKSRCRNLITDAYVLHCFLLADHMSRPRVANLANLATSEVDGLPPLRQQHPVINIWKKLLVKVIWEKCHALTRYSTIWSPDSTSQQKKTTPKISCFRPTSEYKIFNVLFNCPNKQPDSDPISTWLLK